MLFPHSNLQNLNKKWETVTVNFKSAISWFPSKWLCLYCSFLICFLFLQLLMVKCFQEQYSFNCINCLHLSSGLFPLKFMMKWSRVNLFISPPRFCLTSLFNYPRTKYPCWYTAVYLYHMIQYDVKDWMHRLRELKYLGLLCLGGLFSRSSGKAAKKHGLSSKISQDTYKSKE